MSNFNVIEFAPILQQRANQQISQAVKASRFVPWHNRYRDGIDGLVSTRRLRALPGKIVLLGRSASDAGDGSPPGI